MSKITVEELLFNDEPITINRKLAKCLGLKEAVIFQQIHYWLKINEKKNNNFKNGKYWTYNSIKAWQEEEFDFLSIRTVERTLQKLEKDGLLVSNVFNKMKGDKTKWYTIDYDKLLEVCEKNLSKKEDLSLKRSKAGKKGAIAKKCKSENIMQPTWQNGEPCNQLGRTIQPTWQNDTTNLAEAIPETTTKTSTENSTSSSKDKIYNFFESNICELKKTTSKKFIEIIEQCDLNFVQAVIEECTLTNVKSYKGFAAALNNYLNAKCTNAEEVHKHAKNYSNKKKNNRTVKNAKSNKKDTFNNFQQRTYDFDELEKDLTGWYNDDDLAE